MMNPQEEALFFYRKLVYVLYLEIGSLRPGMHPATEAKTDLTSSFFSREKERQAASFYHQTEKETDPDRIVIPYIQRTNLTLEDLRQAFEEGNWQSKFGAVTYGGPRWARIAAIAVDLGRRIKAQEWEAASELVYETKKMKTNQGYLINQFERTERRR